MIRHYDQNDLDGQTVIALIKARQAKKAEKKMKQRKRSAKHKLWQKKIRRIKERFLDRTADLAS